MAKVTGSAARRIIFWAHLSCGVAAGVLILLMSITGVLLTYERQLLDWTGSRNHVAATPGTVPLSADQLAAAARSAHPLAERGSLVFDSNPAAPVQLSLGREGSLLLNPYTGAIVADATAPARGFFAAVERWHRWLGGEPDSLGAHLNDLSNLLFLFLLVSGVYLWLPAVWRWPVVRARMLFRTRYVNGKMRDYCWHHVFAFWVLVPLFLVVLSGVVMSYSWANRLVYAAYGEQAPQRRGPPGDAPARDAAAGTSADGRPRASLEALLQAARGQVAGWRTLSLPITPATDDVRVTAELQSPAPRPPRQTVTLNASDARIVDVSAPQGIGTGSATPGQQARIWMRFVHTGEQYGLIGQTLAGLASLAACFLMYTGLTLAYRRLIVPLYRR